MLLEHIPMNFIYAINTAAKLNKRLKYDKCEKFKEYSTLQEVLYKISQCSNKEIMDLVGGIWEVEDYTIG